MEENQLLQILMRYWSYWIKTEVCKCL